MRFALAHPALFRLTFTHGDPSGGGAEGEDEAWKLLSGYAERFAGADAQRLQLQAWAVAHGLAMLMLDGLLPADDALIDSVIDQQTLFAYPPGSSKDASP